MTIAADSGFNLQLQGRVVLVTGGVRGVGAGIHFALEDGTNEVGPAGKAAKQRAHANACFVRNFPGRGIDPPRAEHFACRRDQRVGASPRVRTQAALAARLL